VLRLGLVGKTNTGKTTFFNAATMLSAEVSSYPFTTKKPNIGIANVQTICACKELNVKDNPVNSKCVSGWRTIPIELIDLPGLIKGASKGRGLGTQFLGVIGRADAILHIVDASGGIDEEGRITKPGSGNPILDVYDIEEEIDTWFTSMIAKNLKKIVNSLSKSTATIEDVFARHLGGVKVKLRHIRSALENADLDSAEPSSWNEREIKRFAREVRKASKPSVIIANKMDIAQADRNLERLTTEFRDSIVIPCCAEAELALKRAEQKGVVEYTPGQETFELLKEDEITKEQKWALNYVQERVLSRWTQTGVQFALNMCVFKVMGMNTVYPIEDEMRLSDKKGNVLPDVFLVEPTSTVRDLAREIHTDLAKNIIHAIDIRTKIRLPADYVLQDRDIVKLITASRRR
jgi:ribosome-binding ATPase YchF (GTP1/OBG family)